MAESFLGYSFCGPVSGNIVPQRTQNTYIRDFANQKKLTVAFMVSEYFDASQSLLLFQQFDHIERIGGFVFYSLSCLPPDPLRRHDFYRRVTAARKPVYFALEDMLLDSPASGAFVEQVYRINNDRRLEENREALIEYFRRK